MNNDLHALVAAYALDALDDVERAEFEAHLSTCESCRTELQEFSAVAADLAMSTSVTPPTHLRAAVLQQLDDIEQAGPSAADQAGGHPPAPVADLAARRRRRFSVTGMLAVAAAVVLLVAGALVITADRGGTNFDDVVSASDAVVTELEGDAVTMQVVSSAELNRVALHGVGVDTLGPGFRYALWAIAGGTPIPAGLFEARDGEIRAISELEDVDPEAWGITIEPETGSAAPTGEIIFFAEV